MVRAAMELRSRLTHAFGFALIHDLAIGLKLVLTFWVPYGLFAAYNIYRTRQRK